MTMTLSWVPHSNILLSYAYSIFFCKNTTYFSYMQEKSGEKFGDLIYLAYLCSVQRDKGMDCTSWNAEFSEDDTYWEGVYLTLCSWLLRIWQFHNRHKTRAAIDARGMCIYILHCIPALPCVMCGDNVGVSIFSVGFWFARFWRYGMSEPLAAERAHLQQPTPFFYVWQNNWFF